MSEPFDVSVIICTYNRAPRLRQAVESVFAQASHGVRYELIIVDNHSTDQTPLVCNSLLRQAPIPARYLCEQKQGVSYARNAAIAIARAPILAFSDDDVCVSNNWVAGIKQAFDEHPQVDGIGGKVLPRWTDEPPDWLTRQHWTPLALQDYGETPILINADNPLCLVAANLALRRQVFDNTGLFSPTLQRVKDGIGSMEDLELHLRLWKAGHQEMYVPNLVVTAEVQAERLTRRYHRKWYRGNGFFYALLRDPQFERSAARLFDVPAHLYKQALRDLLRWGWHRLSGNVEDALLCETRLCFFGGFFSQRHETLRRSGGLGMARDLASFLSALVRPQTNGKVR